MTLIAIGLDSAEPRLLEKFIEDGELPTFRKLKDEGAYGRLDNFDVFTAELPWTTFATGVMPDETGYWTPLTYSPDYSVNTRAAYEYDEYPAFFALGDKFKVCSFDVPQVRLQKNLNGLQINAWGAHSPQIKQESNQPEVFMELLAKYGEHPGLHKDYALALNMKDVRKVYDMLEEGARLRGELCADLIARDEWDLFITVFGEPHGGGHNFWQFEPDHPLYDAKFPGRELLPERPMLDNFKSIDSAIKKILDNAPEDTQVVIFSAHGMGPNTMDLPSGFFLPELMYRYSFDQPALGDVDTISEPLAEQDWGSWERHVWNTSRKGSLLAKFARRYLPSRLYQKVAPAIEYHDDDFPMDPLTAQKVFHDKPWYQPTVWYSNIWPRMKAFALPSFSEGYIRINVEGREKNGIVKPEDYQTVVNEICETLENLKCGRTGTKMVNKIVRTRKDPLDPNPKLPKPDIIVSWQDKVATDVVEHPKYGRIGPVPHFRGGSHRHTGFILASGESIKHQEVCGGHALDIGPTILSLLNAPIPDYMQGKPISLVEESGGSIPGSQEMAG